MPDPTWQVLYNAAVVEFDLTKLPERVEAACDAFINTEYGSTTLSAQRNTVSLMMHCTRCSS